ncbi:DUF58 domain-containing protein [Opitutaceae bacterium EW11]|nr:DUF58 domain-containing protein [Opitutaceae bacterium EW11]
MRQKRSAPAGGHVWHRAGAGWRAFSPRAVLWWFLFPRRTHRTGMTLSGLLLILLAIAIGTAAYNSANNILFLTLSLLLACIILSGMLSAVNFQGLNWRLEVAEPVRAGQEHPVVLVVRNGKRFLPTYSLWFELKVSRSGQSYEFTLRERLDAGAETRIELPVVLPKRGLETLELTYLGSLFPFGFLRKALYAGTTQEVTVWPAPVEYRRLSTAAWQQSAAGELVRRVGQSGDLLALRRYQLDDSHRQIHWKASARLRQLMVRQMSAESGYGFSLWVDLSAEHWKREEQFELLCSFAATLAEDLFKSDRLRAVGVSGGSMMPVRSLRDVELFLDRLAVATMPEPEEASPDVSRNEIVVTPADRVRGGAAVPGLHHQRWRNLLTFGPDGIRGVAAYLHGERAAAA